MDMDTLHVEDGVKLTTMEQWVCVERHLFASPTIDQDSAMRNTDTTVITKPW